MTRRARKSDFSDVPGSDDGNSMAVFLQGPRRPVLEGQVSRGKLTSLDSGLLEDRSSKESQEHINRVADKLSNRPKTTGALLKDWASPQDPDSDGTVNFTLGKIYGGGASNPVKPFINETRSYRGPNTVFARHSRPRWMQGIKGCFVCKGYHMANENHSRHEVRKVIIKLKSKQPVVFHS